MAAVQRAGAFDAAAVGLTNMMNAGGAVLDFRLTAGSGSSGNGDSAGAIADVQVRCLFCFHLQQNLHWMRNTNFFNLRQMKLMLHCCCGPCNAAVATCHVSDMRAATRVGISDSHSGN